LAEQFPRAGVQWKDEDREIAPISFPIYFISFELGSDWTCTQWCSKTTKLQNQNHFFKTKTAFF